MQKKLLLWSWMVLWLAACGQADEQGGQAGSGQMPPPPVTVATPIVKDIIEWDDFSGRFEAVDKVDIRARVGGYLESTNFKEGDFVKKGDLLFTIDQRPYQAALQQAEAAVANAQARVEFTTNEAERAKNLRERGNVPERILEQRIQERRQAQADLSAAKGALNQAKLNMEFTQVRAPIAGRISSNFVTEGNLITGGTADSTLLTTIVSLSPIHFVFDIDEQAYIKYSRLSRIGDRPSGRDNPNPVFVALADEATFRHRGSMDFVDNRIDANTGTMRGRAIFDNTDKFLTPGQFGRIRVLGSGKYQAVLIPDAAIGTDQSRKLVFTVGADNIVKAVPITTGPLVDGLRVIRQGLTGNEKIIINGLQRAQDGAPVTPEPGTIQAKASDIAPELLAIINNVKPTVDAEKLSPEDVSYATHHEDLTQPPAPARDNASPAIQAPAVAKETVPPPSPPEAENPQPAPKKKITKPKPKPELMANPPPQAAPQELPPPLPVIPDITPPKPLDTSKGNKPLSVPEATNSPATDSYIAGGDAALPADIVPATPTAVVAPPPTLAPDQPVHP